MSEVKNHTEAVNEGCDSQYYQRALDLESFGLMGIAPEEKYQREVGVVFDADKGGLSDSLPDNARVLDLACGSGDTSRIIKEGHPAYQVDAVDYSPTAIERAKEKHGSTGVNYQVGDMKHLAKPDKLYDAITCMGRSLAYFKTYPEYIEALKNWNSVLKEGGQVAIEWQEWDKVDMKNAKFHSISGTEVVTQPDFMIRDTQRGDAIKFYGDKKKFEYPGEQLPEPIKVSTGGRIYVDEQGVEHKLGSEEDEFVDLLLKRNMSLIERMLKEAGFTNIRLVEDEKPLSNPLNTKKCRVMTIIAEKPKGQTREGISAIVRDQIENL